MISQLDWIIIIAYLLIAMGLALFHTRRATSGIEHYFLSGRKAAWWLIGTSMIATTFAADTPLAVSGFVIKKGISWNWYWWCLAMSGLMVAFFFARLWRRSKVLTDIELVEFRYSGKPAKFLRGYLAIHAGILNNCIIIGWVNLAMVKVLSNTIGIDKGYALYFCFAFSLLYTMAAGLQGVMVTDFFQFIIAMFGSIYVAIAAVKGVGGLGAIHSSLVAVHGEERAAEITALFPHTGSDLFIPVMVFIFFQWWAAANIGGGSYIVQRILSAKDERNSFFGMLWYNIGNICIRPWPWILTGLCAAILYPKLEDPEIGYVLLMNRFLPAGILGLVIVSFFAAYMSTIDSHLNWGASYLVNDIYKRFMKKTASERHYIVASILVTFLIATLGMLVTMLMKSIREGWYIVTAINGGVAIIHILRWYWWRINAWSEISAMITALAGTIVFRVILAIPYPQVLFYIVPLTVGVSLLVTFLTRPVDRDMLIAFYERIRPGGALWRPIARLVAGSERDTGPKKSIPPYILSVASVYCALFGIGKLLIGPAWVGAILLALSAACGYAVWRLIATLDWADHP